MGAEYCDGIPPTHRSVLVKAHEKLQGMGGNSDLEVNSEQEVDADSDEEVNLLVGEENMLKSDSDGTPMEEGETNNKTYIEYDNNLTEKSFSAISNKTSPSVQGNGKTLMITKQDKVKTYNESLLG